MQNVITLNTKLIDAGKDIVEYIENHHPELTSYIADNYDKLSSYLEPIGDKLSEIGDYLQEVIGEDKIKLLLEEAKKLDKHTPDFMQFIAAEATGELLLEKMFKPLKAFSKTDDNLPIIKYKHGEKVSIFEKSYPESLTNKQIDLPDDLNNRKLRMKYDAHKEDFGLAEANFNKENAELFKQRIIEHINEPDTS